VFSLASFKKSDLSVSLRVTLQSVSGLCVVCNPFLPICVL
jgi:hypothetical protein